MFAQGFFNNIHQRRVVEYGCTQNLKPRSLSWNQRLDNLSVGVRSRSRITVASFVSICCINDRKRIFFYKQAFSKPIRSRSRKYLEKVLHHSQGRKSSKVWVRVGNRDSVSETVAKSSHFCSGARLTHICNKMKDSYICDTVDCSFIISIYRLIGTFYENFCFLF